MQRERILPERELIKSIAAGAAKGMAEQPSLTVEETFEELERLLDQLEDEDSSLEDSFCCFERGMKLVQSCSAQIDKVEKQMILLQDTWQEGQTAPFAGADEDRSEEEEDDGL